MLSLLLPSFFLYLFSLFNLLGIRQSLVINHLVFFVIALIFYYVVSKIGRNFFQINIHVIYWFFIFLLVGTYILGLEIKGSRRWIDLYFFNFQPSEFFKIFFILFFAKFLAKENKQMSEIGVFILSLIYFIIPTLIIFKQPDLGNALVYFIIFVSIVLFSYIPKKILLYFILILVLVTPLGWFFMKDYQRDRLTSFLNPHIDQKGASYNMRQALITTGSGQFSGKGLGLGTQSRLYFLPENHTDFAFSSLVEQFGFMGGGIVIGLFAFLMYSIVRKLSRLLSAHDEDSKERFLYAIGFLSYIVFQVVVNIGMNLGIMPVAGIALPFISYGGSSLITILTGLALL